MIYRITDENIRNSTFISRPRIIRDNLETDDLMGSLISPPSSIPLILSINNKPTLTTDTLPSDLRTEGADETP